MIYGIELFFSLFNNLAIFIALVTVYGYLLRQFKDSIWFRSQAILGFSFGVFAIGCMYAKISVFEGVIVDQRNAIVVLSGAFGGPLSAVISAVLTGTYRIYLGGSGILAGVIGVSLSAITGILLNKVSDSFSSKQRAAASSLVATIIILPGFLFVKDIQTGWGLLKSMALPYGFAIFCGIFMVGLLLNRENEIHYFEQSFQEGEKRFRGLVDSMADLIWEVDSNARYTYCSENVESILGYTVDEMIGKTPFDFLAPDEAKKIGDVFSKIVAKKKPLKDLENWNIRKDGSQICLLTNGVPILNEKGELLGFRGVDKDITESMLSEIALIKSEEKHRKLVSNISDVIAIVDKGCIVRYKSSNVKKLFGWKPDELIGRHGLYTVHPEDKKRIRKQVADLLKYERKSVRVEYDYLCKDGSIRPIELTAVNMLHDPIINGLLINYKDISERKDNEKTLRHSEEKYRTMIECSNDMIWTIDTAGNLTFFNEQAEKVTGLTMGDWIGKSFIPLIIEEDLPMMTQVFQNCLKGKSQHYEFRFKKQDGNIFTFSVNTAPILKDGDINGIVSFGRDITEQQKLESQIRQSQKMESIGTLAGGIAHDFNNILFPILGYSEMLLNDAPKGSSLHDNLNEIYTGALRAKDLVGQILTFSRQESSELMLVKMQPILKEALRFIRSTIPTTIDMKQDIQADCGVIKADPTQIHQIIMNLTTNAYHAMKDTGGDLKVSLKEIKLGEYDVITPDMTPGDYACLKVIDTGMGMDKNLTKKIFDPFFTTKEKGKGTGMGLSVVHGIINSMGAAIQVYSEPGKGTEFTIYIAIEKPSSKEPQRKAEQSIQGGTEHILIVDDEESIIAMEKQILDRLGYKVTSRTSSIEALEAFRVNPYKFDLIISDMAMPNMSGDKLAAELIKIRPGIPILLCTGFSENIPQKKAVSLGINSFLMKPIIMKDFAHKIRKALDKSNN